MTAQPQPPQYPPQRPVYYHELNQILEKYFARITGHIYDQKPTNWYNNFTSREQNFANATLNLSQQLAALMPQIHALTQEMAEMKATQQTMLQMIQENRDWARDAHAEAMEAIGELRQAVKKLQRNDGE